MGAGGGDAAASSGVGGAAGAGVARTCHATSAERCSCIEGQPGSADPECSSTSVETRAGDVGVCCQGGLFCDCVAYACKNNAALGYCVCGASATLNSVAGPVVTICPTSSAPQQCCYSPDINDCTCSTAACDNGRLRVATCSLADVMVCADRSFRVDRCSTVGPAADGGSAGVGGQAGRMTAGSGGSVAAGSGGAGGAQNVDGGAGDRDARPGVDAADAPADGDTADAAPALRVGEPCARAADCASGHCTDGVCCDSACAGTCASCNLPGQVGTCSPVRSAEDPDSCAGAIACDPSAACKSRNGALCTSATGCLSGFCVDDRCCDTSCSAACGVCDTPGTEGTCTLAKLRADIRSCDGTQACDGAGACKLADGQSCGTAGECAFGACISGRCCANPSCTPVVAWTRTFGGDNIDDVAAAAFTATGAIRLAGALGFAGDLDPGALDKERSGDMYLLELDPDGRFQRAQTWSGGALHVSRILALANGDTLVAGVFNGTVDFDPTAGIDERVGGTFGVNDDIFIVRLGSDGSYRWTATFGNPGDYEYPHAVAEAPDGSLYVAGSYEAPTDFDPSSAVDTHSHTGSAGVEDAFVTKLGADGSYGWTTTFGSAGTDSVRGLAVTPSGDVVISGCFAGAVDFDPGPAEHIVTPTVEMTSTPWTFVTRLTAQHGFVWTYVAQEGGCAKLAAAPDGSFYVGSEFNIFMDFDPFGAHIPLFSTDFSRANSDTTDVWIAKLTSGGAYVWSRSFGSTAQETLTSLMARSDGSVVASGSYSFGADFDPSAATDIANEFGSYVWRTTADGTYAETQRFLGLGLLPSGVIRTTSLAGAANGAFIVVGAFNLSGDFDPGPSTDRRTSVGADDAFVTKFMP